MQVLQFWSDAHRETPIDMFVRELFAFDEEYVQELADWLCPGAADVEARRGYGRGLGAVARVGHAGPDGGSRTSTLNV